jgi:hypothetical protein
MTTFETKPDQLRGNDNFDAPDHAGWYPDPHREHHLRYFSGASWSDHVTHFGPNPCSGCGPETNQVTT